MNSITNKKSVKFGTKYFKSHVHIIISNVVFAHFQLDIKFWHLTSDTLPTSDTPIPSIYPPVNSPHLVDLPWTPNRHCMYLVPSSQILIRIATGASRPFILTKSPNIDNWVCIERFVPYRRALRVRESHFFKNDIASGASRSLVLLFLIKKTDEFNKKKVTSL